MGMDKGPWFIARNPLFLHNWSSDPIEKLSLKEIPVWIKLWNVPLEPFTPEGIACIEIAVGKQLYLDRATTKRCRVSFAHVYVEYVDGATPLKSIEVETEGLRIMSIHMEYPWGQSACSICKKNMVIVQLNV